MANTNIPGFDSSELKELKQKLVDGCHILDREGITDGFGHVSMRDSRNRSVSHHRGRKPRLRDVGSARSCSTSTATISAATKPPPYEWPIHACIMRARPDVMSVCHTHSKWSALFSVLKGGLRPMHMYAKFLPAGGPPIYPAAGLIGTVERGEALAGDFERQRGGLVARARRRGGRRKPRASDPAHHPACLSRRARAHGRRAWRAALYDRRGIGDFLRRPGISRAPVGILLEPDSRAPLFLTARRTDE